MTLMPISTRHLAALAAVALAAFATPALGGITLITLPARERVEIQLDNPLYTLVEEERVVPLARGVNDVVFAWANTNIDAASIQLRCLTDPENISVLSVSYPPNQNALTWQVASPRARAVRVRISYLIQRLNKTFAYKAIASPDERTLTLWQYIQLHNSANEDFGEAGMWAGFGERLERPIGAAETKRLLAARFTDVAVRKTYTADLSTYGYLDAGKKQLRIPMHYVLANDKAHGLGEFPLMAGKARIFQMDGQGTTAFLGEDWAPLTARDEEMALSLGVARDVVVIRTISQRKEKQVLGRLKNYQVTVKYEIENFKDQPVVLDIAESMTALRREILGETGRSIEWTLGKGGTLREMDAERTTADRAVFHVELPARGEDQKARKVVHTLEVVIKNEW
jgi:hypothetical protein